MIAYKTSYISLFLNLGFFLQKFVRRDLSRLVYVYYIIADNISVCWAKYFRYNRQLPIANCQLVDLQVNNFVEAEY